MKKGILFGIVCLFCTTSCLYKDLGNYDYVDVPTIKIDSVKSKSDASIELLIDTLKIDPVVSYGGVLVNDDEFDYGWYMKTKHALTEISKEKKFRRVMTKNGKNEFRFIAKNKKTGLSKYADVNCNAISRTERGWYILKETADGNTEIDAQLRAIDGTFTFRENLITVSCGAPLEGQPLTMDYTKYRWNNIAFDTLELRSALFPISSEDIKAIGILDLKKLADFEDLFNEVMPPKEDRKIEGLYASADDQTQLLVYNNGRIRVRMGELSSEFSPEYYGNYQMQAKPLVGLGTADMIPVYDKTVGSFKYVAGNTSAIRNIGDSALMAQNGIPFIPWTYLNGDLLYSGQCNGNKGHAILRDRVNPDFIYFCHLNETNLHMQFTFFIPKVDTLSAVNFTFPTADSYSTKQDGSVVYFRHGNKISIYDPASKKETLNIMDFGNEEVTWMKHIDFTQESSTLKFSGLAIATHTDGKYTLRLYTVKPGGALDPVPFQVHTGTGKVKTAMYIKPGHGYRAIYY